LVLVLVLEGLGCCWALREALGGSCVVGAFLWRMSDIVAVLEVVSWSEGEGVGLCNKPRGDGPFQTCLLLPTWHSEVEERTAAMCRRNDAPKLNSC